MRHDPIIELMEKRWTAAEEAESLTLELVALTLSCARSALQLVTAQRHARDAADELADALAKESSARLCKILALEAAARGKKPEKDVELPRRRAKKGAKRGPQ